MADSWHSQSIEGIFHKLGTSGEGLTSWEAQRRLKDFGPNEISPAKRKNILGLFLKQFKSPLIYILLVAALITFLLKHTVDTWVILGVVFFNAFFGLLHEVKAEKAMEALSKIMALKTKVRRGGVLMDLPAVDLVPGDIVEISGGMKVPADLRMIQQEDLRVDEAVLTGESVLQEKSENVLIKDIPLGDRVNMLFGGTMVISGRGLAVAIATGKNTEFGKIAEEVQETPETQTPLQLKLTKFAKNLLSLILGVVFVIFFIGILKGLDFLQMFLIALSATISAIPEGLPAVVTVTLAVGASRMAKRKAIIRKLVAVETLGSVTVIASDKTGTLTHNQMTIEKVYSHLDSQTYQISGSGYEPKGEITPLPEEGLKQLLTLSILCSDAEIFEENREWNVTGDPTEGALVTAASKSGIFKEDITKKYPRLDEMPFDTKNGFMATLHQNFQGKNVLIVKGKIEKILEMAKLNEQEQKKLIQKMEDFARGALRVIAIASKEVAPDYQEILSKDLNGLEFLGFAGMIDPPRAEAIVAVKDCQQAGIRPIMLTGDYPLTAKAVAQELGIINQEKDGVISGQELEKLDPEDFQKALGDFSVFARISPETKLKIVESLQGQNQIVSVTGDGINDAPALKKADIGVAMGEGGTDVSREVADLVLTDNNVAAVEEGRTIFQNIRRVIFYLISTSIGELIIIFSALLLFPPPYNLPLLPVQILWLNLVTDGTVGLSLAMEPTHKGVLGFSPRSPKEGIFNRIMIARTLLVGLVMLVGTMILYGAEVQAGADINRARTIAFITMVVFQVFNVLNCRSLRESIFSLPF
ncbi:MAG: ATPase, partial [Berkelbacteria bacterium GW2011_GWB1_38_5]